LTQQRLLAKLPAVGTGGAFAGTIICVNERSGLGTHARAENPASGVQPDNLAYTMYTSGTTGLPKGVQVSHRAIGNRLQWSQAVYPLTVEDRVLQVASFSFDIALWEILGPLIAGARLVLARPGGQQEPNYLLTLMREQQVTVAHFVPSLLQVLLDDAGDTELAACTSLRAVFCGGEAVPTDLPERFFARLDADLYQFYGPTEAAINATYWTCLRDRKQRVLSIGRPIANTQIYLLDAQLQPVPSGVVGELYIGGTCLARGYLNQPGLTAERFIPSPFVTLTKEARGDSTMLTPLRGAETRLYRTGDMARYHADGSLEYLGRRDDQVKIRRFRVELGEVEAVLRQHPAVREAVVTAQNSATGDKRLVAYVLLHPQPLQEKGTDIELWPSIGEYFVYDELIYYGLTSDEPRNEHYKAVINRLVKGKTVVDIGTGRDAILARLCAAAGASKVYALELLAESYQQAKQCVQQLGLDDTITVLHGDARQAVLPELADVCVTEIFEAIGGAEGADVILNDARHLLKTGGVVIPERSITNIAAVSLPDTLGDNLQFTPVSGHYVEEIFKQVGYPFDLRLCIKNFPQSHVISTTAIFEDLDFSGRTAPEFRREVILEIQKNAHMHGFLLWLTLHMGYGETLDILEGQYSWFPAYFPIFEPTIEVVTGDVIQAVCRGMLCENGVNPDYAIEGRVLKQNGAVIEFSHLSSHHQQQYKASPFYAKLFREDTVPIRPAMEEPQHDTWSDDVRTYLGATVPDYMVPAAFVRLDALPLTPNGKVDRHALLALEITATRRKELVVLPRDSVELQLTRIFEQVLQVHPVGVTDNFFTLGGHSLLAMRLMAQVHKQFRQNLPLSTLFEGATVEQLAHILRRQTLASPPSPLVRIQPLGTKRPLFCVHAGAGNVLCYRELAHHLGTDQPLYGLQSLGLSGECQPLATVEELAARYCEAIRAIQPQGPYNLLGWCFGGLIALEIALQLRSQGQEISLLALLDTFTPDSDGLDFLKDEVTVVEVFISEFVLPFAPDLQFYSHEELQQLPPEERFSYLVELARRIQFLPPDSEPTHLRSLFTVYQQNAKSVHRYQPHEVYPQRITFFQASDNPSTQDSATWRKYAAEPPEVYAVPGDHATLIQEPHVQVLAEQLNRCLTQGK